MSTSTERRAMKEVLAGYSLLSTREAAALMGVVPATVSELIRAGKIPAVNRSASAVRANYGIDPMDAVAYVLSEREGITVEAYWTKYGVGGADRAREYLEKVGRFRA